VSTDVGYRGAVSLLVQLRRQRGAGTFGQLGPALDPDLTEWLTARAQQKGLSVADMVVEAVRQAKAAAELESA
jgi:hypothetical protein